MFGTTADASTHPRRITRTAALSPSYQEQRLPWGSALPAWIAGGQPFPATIGDVMRSRIAIFADR
jgi:hypothetical protein